MSLDRLHPLLAFADGPAAALPGGAAAGRGADAAAQEPPDRLWSDNDDIDELRLQRWAVIVPEGERGRRLRAIVEPLARLRGEQQGATPATFAAPARMSRGEALEWCTRMRASFGRPREVPRYCMIVGDLDEVALELQQALALGDACPGRLAFDSEEDLAAYVDKAVRADRAASGARPAVLVHAVAADPATKHGRERLAEPLLRQLGDSHGLGELPATELHDLDGPALDRPGQEAVAPGFLFSLTHGYGGERGRGFASYAARRAEQGALVVPGRGRLTGEALRTGAFLPGGFWFLFACYGAGTPGESCYAPWLRALGGAGGKIAEEVLGALPGAGERPFVAAAPKAALANSAGPLACFGHVDVAWQFSYSEADPIALSRPDKFGVLVEDACRGRRAGALARTLARHANEAALKLAAAAEQARGGTAVAGRLAHLWLLHHDLAAFVLLGDPALRLVDPGRSGHVAGDMSVGTGGAAAELVALARRIGAAKLEEAFARALVGDGARKAAAWLGIELAELRALEDAYRAAGRKALGG